MLLGTEKGGEGNEGDDCRRLSLLHMRNGQLKTTAYSVLS